MWRQSAPFVSQVLHGSLERILMRDDVAAAVSYAEGQIRRLLSGQVELGQLVMTGGACPSVRASACWWHDIAVHAWMSYRALPGICTCVGWYVCKSGGPGRPPLCSSTGLKWLFGPSVGVGV
jgi:hypothetical protein